MKASQPIVLALGGAVNRLPGTMVGIALLRTRRAVVLITVLALGAVGASSGALAIALRGAGRGTVRSHRFGREASLPAAAGLIARLAVLRRPQAPADALPGGVRVTGPHGSIIPSLTRLVATPAGASVYLVVSTPRGGSPPLWSPKLGDQVGIVTVAGGSARGTFPVPAADLTNGFAVEFAGAGMPSSAYALAHTYQMGIVPDGVARVRWTFANATAKRTYTVDVSASNNVAITPARAGTPFLLRAAWYAADGSAIPTSDSAMRHAIAARDNILRQRIIRQDARSSFQPSSAILADFAVFSVTSRSGVRVGDLTISHPRLASVPLAILDLTAPGQRPQLDPLDMRQATTRNGVSVWITPGRRSICAAALDPSQSMLPLRYGSGAGEGCSGTLAQAESAGTGFSTCCFSGYSWNFGVLPNAHPTLTIRVGPHTHRTIRPPDGVYIYRARQ